MFINISFFQAALRMATPIAFGALGGMYNERAGVVNIGLEGIMLNSAFFAVYATYLTGNPIIGVLAGLGSGFLIGIIIAILTVKYQGNQIVVGTGLNVFGLGFSAYMCQKIWGSRGASDSIIGLGDVNIPFLAKIPWIGPILNKQNSLVYLMILIVVLSHFLLYRTRWGLRLRAVGENPQAADTSGINVYQYKYFFIVLGSMITGLGGVFLSVGHLNFFAWGMTSGRGFIALAAMILGKWTPFGCLAASFLFGITDALQMRLQALGILPSQIILLLPYVITILVLAGFVGRSIAPSDYKPYVKQ
ncbi:MAG TPA: ABC transporter permease [Candidatus Atribacteria bacterium]|nr:ABC transporter permease [Candidatus Atribacteria bacterium]HCU22809.1 ABC transporter permease [Candidatus Atribacteria bacterium]